MTVRVAIPEPTSLDAEYNERSIQSYLEALQAFGVEPVRIPPGRGHEEVGQILADVQGVLLPGSPYDIEPQIYGEDRMPECGEADPGRAAIDGLLLEDAFNLRKPILAICYGVQALNTWRNGSLIQDVEAQLKTRVNHQPRRGTRHAHRVRIEAASRLAALAPPKEAREPWVNSSHHQAIRMPGEKLNVAAVCPKDGVIEAVELDSPDHFVLGVQWHPERTFSASPLSRAIFEAFAQAARAWDPKKLEVPAAK